MVPLRSRWGRNGVLGAAGGALNGGPADGPRRRPPDRADRPGGDYRSDAQEELPPVRAALEADRQSLGAAQGFGAEEVPRDQRATGAAGGCPSEGLYSHGQLPEPELFVPSGHGLEHCLPIPEGSERDRSVPSACAAHHSCG